MKLQLNEIFDFIKNGASIKQGLKGGYPITRIETISNMEIDRNKMGYAGISDLTKYKDYLLNDGDILMSHINSEIHLGKAAIFEMEDINEKIIHGMNLLCLRPKKELLHPKYAFYYFNSSNFRRKLQKIIKKSVNQASFSVSDLKNIEINLPEKEIQIKIANTLSKAQWLIDKRKEQISELRVLTQSVFLKMFGDPVINPNRYKVEKMGNKLKFLTSGSRGWAKYYSNSGELFITIKNVKNGEVILDNVTYVNVPDTKEAERTKVQKGDLLISITADLGRTAVVSEEIAESGAYINQHLSLLRLTDNCNPFYISFYLESAAGKRQFQTLNQEGVKAGLNFDAIKSLDIMLPPLDLQNKFEEVYLIIIRQKIEIENSLKVLEGLFNSLMQRAFNGELFNEINNLEFA